MDEAIRTTKRDLAPSGNLFRDIRELLYERFVCLHLVHVPRLRTSLLRLVGAGYRANHMNGRIHSQSLYTIWALAI